MNNEKFKELEGIINKDYSNMAGIIIKKGGNIEYENYFNGCDNLSKIHVYSVTKSIVSILFGIAFDKGLIDNLNKKVLDFFPEYEVKNKEKTICDVTLENLLTMTAPYKYKIPPYIKYFTSEDWVKFSLDLLRGKGKIGEFNYTPLIGPDILSAILKKVTNQAVLDFAKENLFSKLDINIGDNIIFKSKEEQMAFNKATDISGWVCDPKGINTAGWGLTLSALDMAKIGQLYLDKGMYNNKEVVSPSWIEKSTEVHSKWKKMNLSFGYLWWIIDDRGSFAAMGDGGNTIYVNPGKELVVASSSLFKPKIKDRIDFIKKYIEPRFD